MADVVRCRRRERPGYQCRVASNGNASPRHGRTCGLRRSGDAGVSASRRAMVTHAAKPLPLRQPRRRLGARVPTPVTVVGGRPSPTLAAKTTGLARGSASFKRMIRDNKSLPLFHMPNRRIAIHIQAVGRDLPHADRQDGGASKCPALPIAARHCRPRPSQRTECFDQCALN
jgi:hypothetical protein